MIVLELRIFEHIYFYGLCIFRGNNHFITARTDAQNITLTLYTCTFRLFYKHKLGLENPSQGPQFDITRLDTFAFLKSMSKQLYLSLL